MPKPKLTAKCVRLLKKVKAHILNHPSQFRMDQFHCGTAACIGGSALVLDPKVKFFETVWDAKANTYRECSPVVVNGQCDVRLESIDYTDWWEAARAQLSLTQEQAERLFQTSAECGNWGEHIGRWPEPFDSRYLKAKTYRTKAKIAAARIDHFLQTGE